MSRQGRIGKHATTISRDDQGVLRVTYHATPVVTVYPNGKIILNHGGWTSVTTKTRMNQASNQLSLGFNVWQEHFAWFVSIDGHVIDFDHNPLTIRNGHD